MGSIDYVLILKVDWIHTWKLRFDSVPFVRQVLKRKSIINFFALLKSILDFGEKKYQETSEFVIVLLILAAYLEKI